MSEKFIEEYASEPQSSITFDEDKHVRAIPAASCHQKRRWISSLLRATFWRSLFIEIFLPRGYPHSVSSDYIDYQIWDTVQAFASSMTSALATEAVLRGAGVGDQNASALAATITWLLRDGLGMISRILFAWSQSAQLDADCKRWRLVADLLNDLAFSIELMAAIFPNYFTLLVCFSSLARSIVAVAGGATRTTVVQHQARANNVADVSAKDGSQETLVNVTALVCSLIFLPLVSGHTLLVWIFYTIFTAIHLFANYRAVKSLHFDTINQKLLNQLTRKFIATGDVCSVEEGNNAETLLFGCSKRYYGCRLLKIFELKSVLKRQSFMVSSDRNNDIAFIAMANGAKHEDQLKAAFCAEYVIISGRVPSTEEEQAFMDCLKSKGWKTNQHRLAFDQWTFTSKQ